MSPSRMVSSSSVLSFGESVVGLYGYTALILRVVSKAVSPLTVGSRERGSEGGGGRGEGRGGRGEGEGELICY